MKKILIATTALVATASFAVAEVSVSGGASLGLKNDGTDTTAFNELDFGLSGSGESDNGISFGASLDLDTDYKAGAAATSPVKDPEAFLAFGGAKLTVGDVGPASDIGGYADVGFDGIGVDSDPTTVGSADVVLTYDFSDFTVGASYGTTTDDWALGLSGAFGPVSFDYGVGVEDSSDDTISHLTVGFSAGDFAITVFGAAEDVAGTESTYYGGDVEYSAGDLTVTFAFALLDDAGAEDNYGIGASYDLGGGLSVAGGIGSVADETVWDAGFKMSF